MKKLTQFILGFVSAMAILAGCSRPPDLPAEKSNLSAGSYSGKSLSDWTEQYDEMSRLLKLDENECAELKSAFETQIKPLQDWYTKNGSKLADLEKKMFQAARQKDLGNVKQYASMAKPMRAEVISLHEQFDRAIENSLAAEKRWNWFAYKNVQRIVKHTASLDLSDSQLVQMNEFALKAVTDSKFERSPEQVGYGKLLTHFKAQVLTAEQKKQFDDLLKRKPLSFVFGKN